MRFLLDRYNKIYAVNLVNQHGSEKTLANEFQQSIREFAHEDVKYHAFDFHKECKNMRFDRVDILVQTVQKELEEFGFFLRAADGTCMRKQQGVFRNNCIDSLDRTNVVQVGDFFFPILFLSVSVPLNSFDFVVCSKCESIERLCQVCPQEAVGGAWNHEVARDVG